MSDSAQNLEQLIRQYTQELLRLQREHAADIPAIPTANNQPAPPPLPDDDPEDILEDILEGELPDREEDRPDDLGDVLEEIFDDDREDRRPAPPAPPQRPEPPRPEPPRPEPPERPRPQPPMPPTPTPEEDSFGKLAVRVFKAGGAFPIPGAAVSIFRQADGQEPVLVTTTTTDRSGFTPAITLPTVNAALSLEPGHDQPYTTYMVQVRVPGYFTVDDLLVPVYSGVTSVQPAEMVPLPENFQGDTTVTLPESGPDL